MPENDSPGSPDYRDPSADWLVSEILERAREISDERGERLFMPFEIWREAERQVRKKYGIPESGPETET